MKPSCTSLPPTLFPSAGILLNRLAARGTFRHVQVLLKLAELGSVHGAAGALGIPPSSVNASLASLEEILETELFQSHGSGVQPTAVCSALLPHARQVARGFAGIAEAVPAHHERGTTVVRVLPFGAAANALLMDALPAFASRYARVEVRLGTFEGEDPLLAIARGEVDLVACRRPAAIPQGWGFRELLPDRFAVVCASGHPLATGMQVRWEELSRQVWLLPPAGSAARNRFDRLVARRGNEPPSYAVIASVASMTWWLLREHELLAFVPFSIVREQVERGELVEVPTEEMALEEPLGLLQPHGGSEATMRLAGFLAQHFAAVPIGESGAC